MDVQRLCDVLDKHLAGRTYIVGEEYSIADIICFPWFNGLKSAYKVYNTYIMFIYNDMYKTYVIIF